MPIWKLQTAFTMDSALPRDVLVITPHFNDAGVGTDPQGLCDDLAAALSAWWTVTGQITVTAYDAQGTPPVYPQGSATVNPGGAPPSAVPREIAVCLSFYSVRNIPRQRGRLYIPFCVPNSAGVGGTGGVRPNASLQAKVGALAPIFADLGGVDVDWSVYSRTDDVARPVTNWWVDDEWDTVRSRGLRSTDRIVGTVDEA